jgi:streptogramin lyase
MLAGCGSQSTIALGTQDVTASVHGHVYGGQQPISGATVSVIEAGTTGYGSTGTVLKSTTTDANGNFDFGANPYSCSGVTAPLYITSAGGNPGVGANNPHIMLAAPLGECANAPNESVNINEVTTVATAYALASYAFVVPASGTLVLEIGAPASQLPAMRRAMESTIPQLVNIATGVANTSTSTVTLESAKLNTLANILAACVNTTGSTATGSACGNLFKYTNAPNAYAATDTLQAALYLDYFPFQNVTQLYKNVPPVPPFVGLTSAPNDFTLAIGYIAPGFGLRTLAASTNTPGSTSPNLDIDANGNIWFPTNSTTSVGVGEFSPSTNSFSGPYLTNLVFPQYVTIDQNNMLYVTDLGGTSVGYLNTTSPGTSGYISVGYPSLTIATAPNNTLVFTANGTTTSALAPLIGTIDTTRTKVATYTGGGYLATGLAPVQTTTANTLKIYTNSSSSSSPCELGLETLTTSGNNTTAAYSVVKDDSTACITGGVAVTYYNTTTNPSLDVVSAAGTADQACSAAKGCFTPTASLNLPQGVATDGGGEVWIANSGNGSVSVFNNYSSGYAAFSTVPYLHDTNNGGTMTSPYGIGVDAAGNVWVSNAACSLSATCNPSSFTLTELVGAGIATITPLSAQGNGTSTGVTPSLTGGVGSQPMKVLLMNRQPMR